MANDDEVFDSHEQSERARAWFQNNGGSLLIAVLTAMAVIWGYKGFQSNKIRTAEQAGLNYQALATAVDAKKDAEVSQLSAEMRKNFGGTTYAALAGMAEAKYLNESGKVDAAENALRIAADAGSSPQIKVIANLRLARLLIAKNKAQDAISVLDKLKDEGFKSQINELRGDALTLLGKGADAKLAYSAALTATDLATAGRSTLQQKLDNLSG